MVVIRYSRLFSLIKELLITAYLIKQKAHGMLGVEFFKPLKIKERLVYTVKAFCDHRKDL
jgi:hypothetical protein